MRTINQEVKLYEFKELDKSVRARLIEKEGQYQVEDNYWSEYTLDYWKEKLEILGFVDPEIRFSGFWSQGDGASFTAVIDLEILCNHLIYCADSASEAKILALVGRSHAWIPAEVVRSEYHYAHEDTCGVHWCENFDTYESAFDYNQLSLSLAEEIKVLDQVFTKYQRDLIVEALRKDMKPKVQNNLEIAWKYTLRVIEALRMDLCQEIYRDLEKEYEWLQSEENVLQFLEDCKEYTADGEEWE